MIDTKEIQMRNICIAWIWLCLACSLLPGQIGTEGAFFGTVTDSAGASVPNAEVVATHIATGISKQAVTDSQGNFNLFALPIGKYSVAVKAKGFKTWTLTDSELTVGARNRLSPVLTVGELTESVSVVSNAELLQTEKSSAETVVELQQIRQLPLDTRNPLALIALVPGMRYVSTQAGGEKATYVQGQGLRQNKTQFQLDGFASNAPMDEGGTAIPNVDAIAEFSVETLNFSAENGRGPTQVKVATKAGTNEIHGSVWEFNQNDFYNARNTFAAATPRVRYNQFGGAVGGPVIRNKTFFYGNFQGTVTKNSQVFNTQVVTPAMKQGDFSAVSRIIKDPTTGLPFPGNIIPQARFNASSSYFLPQILSAPNGTFNTVAGTSSNVWEGTGRVDHQITQNQHVYGRYVTSRSPSLILGNTPTAYSNDMVTQHNLGLSYNWTISPNTLFSLGGGMMRTSEQYTSPDFGVKNEASAAGVQGFPTAGREAWIGSPQISFGNGYLGNSTYSTWGTPGQLWGHVYDGKADWRHYRGNHSLSAGIQLANVQTYASHGSCCVRGNFSFTNQYTNDGFADFLLGYAAQAQRNAPLDNFGTDRAPYMGLFVNDNWRILPNLSVEVGLRYERWFARHNLRDGAATFDPALGKIVAGNRGDGTINPNVFLSTPNVIASTAGLVVTARSAGYPDTLWEGNGNWAPRIGLVYRPFGHRQFVVRTAYGLFYNTLTGNRSASAAANPPFWGVDTVTKSVSQLAPWNTLFSSDPNAFGIFGMSEAQDPRLKPARTQEWNVTIQTALPLKTALTVSYVGTSVGRELASMPYNIPTIGPHANIQADRPIPQLSVIDRLENNAHTWYHGLQSKFERRFAAGISYTFSYSFSKSLGQNNNNNVDEGAGSPLLAYAPPSYYRDRLPFDYRHLEYATLVWELPYGHGRKFGSNLGRALDAVAGGWNLTLTESARSGTPFSVGGGVNGLGNGDGAPRSNLIGDPHISNPSVAKWFNTAAFAVPAPYTFGSTPLGILDGPGFLQFNTALSKNFRVAEKKQLQLRGEAFNAFNRANYGNPNNNASSSQIGRITSTSGPARYLQLGVQFIF